MVTFVPGTAKLPATSSALVSVLKRQLALTTPPFLPLPVASASLPFTGSTRYSAPETPSHPVQRLLTQAYPGPNDGLATQSASAQQLPGTHRLLQQKSPALAAQAPLTLHADETHLPVSGREGAVWQIL